MIKAAIAISLIIAALLQVSFLSGWHVWGIAVPLVPALLVVLAFQFPFVWHVALSAGAGIFVSFMMIDFSGVYPIYYVFISIFAYLLKDPLKKRFGKTEAMIVILSSAILIHTILSIIINRVELGAGIAIAVVESALGALVILALIKLPLLKE